MGGKAGVGGLPQSAVGSFVGGGENLREMGMERGASCLCCVIPRKMHKGTTR